MRYWRRERCWQPTLSAGRSEALGTVAEPCITGGLRSIAPLPASQRLGSSSPCGGCHRDVADSIGLETDRVPVALCFQELIDVG